MQPATSPTAQRFQALIGPDFRVVEFAQTTRTAADAAAAIGCAVGQTAKTLVFRAADGAPVLAITSGANRADERKLAALVGGTVERADADWVRDVTGYAVGVLQAFDAIWAAAGTPNAVFRLTPPELERLAGGRWADLCKRSAPAEA